MEELAFLGNRLTTLAEFIYPESVPGSVMKSGMGHVL